MSGPAAESRFASAEDDPMRFEWNQLGPLLRDFPNRPGALRVLATNLIPLAGVLLLGWLPAVATLSFFVDALLTAASLTFVLTVHAIDETSPHIKGPSRWAAIKSCCKADSIRISSWIGTRSCFKTGRRDSRTSTFTASARRRSFTSPK